MMVSIHHYDLAASATGEDLRAAFAAADRRELFDLPGLREYRLLQGRKGERIDEYAAVWTYESRTAWEALWGPLEDPVSKPEYPDRWNVWEDELLEPILAGDPDEVEYTSYEVLHGSG